MIKLEKLCTFAEDCVISNYGAAFQVCYGKYVDCSQYKRFITERLKEIRQRKK